MAGSSGCGRRARWCGTPSHSGGRLRATTSITPGAGNPPPRSPCWSTRGAFAGAATNGTEPWHGTFDLVGVADRSSIVLRRLRDALRHVQSRHTKASSRIDVLCARVVGGHAQPDLVKSLIADQSLESGEGFVATALSTILWQDAEVANENGSPDRVGSKPDISDDMSSARFLQDTE